MTRSGRADVRVAHAAAADLDIFKFSARVDGARLVPERKTFFLELYTSFEFSVLLCEAGIFADIKDNSGSETTLYSTEFRLCLGIDLHASRCCQLGLTIRSVVCGSSKVRIPVIRKAFQ